MRVKGLGFEDTGGIVDTGDGWIGVTDPGAGNDGWNTGPGTTYNGLPENPGNPNLPTTGPSIVTALTSALNAVSGIFRGGVTPQLPTGAVLVQGADGKQYIRYSNGQQVLYTASGSVSGNMGAWVIGGIALIVVMGMAKK